MTTVKDYIVRMSSGPFGAEDFHYTKLKEATDGLLRLYRRSVKINDGVERIIGLVVNPPEKE